MSASSQVRDLVARYQLRAKKRFGQNFLISDPVLDDIANTALIAPGSGLIEIGPGPGTLTRRLGRSGLPVVAIEKDATLVDMLRDELAALEQVEIVQGDALVGELADLLPLSHRPAVVGNIPYNISSPLLVRLVEQRHRLGPVTLLMQREVVDRLLAAPGSKVYGRLSVLLQMYATASRGRLVQPGCFWPPPKVQSAVISWTWRSEPAVPVPDPQHFERVVKTAFGQRRKMLRNALRSGFGDLGVQACVRGGFDLEQRAERLSLADFARLAELLHGVQPSASRAAEGE